MIKREKEPAMSYFVSLRRRFRQCDCVHFSATIAECLQGARLARTSDLATYRACAGEQGVEDHQLILK